MYAIVQVGGKQYKVKEGDLLRTEKVKGVNPGEILEIKEVFFASYNGTVLIGNPFVEGVLVKLRKIKDGKGKKVIVFKFKRKKRYRRKYGHRQGFSLFKVEKIEIYNAKS